MSAHTPGPWDIRTLENFGWNIVHYREGDRFDIVRVAKAAEVENARLIAAAPTMKTDIEEFMRRLGPRWFLEQNWFPASVAQDQDEVAS